MTYIVFKENVSSKDGNKKSYMYTDSHYKIRDMLTPGERGGKNSIN